jgi:hypothetical protein
VNRRLLARNRAMATWEEIRTSFEAWQAGEPAADEGTQSREHA